MRRAFVPGGRRGTTAPVGDDPDSAMLPLISELLRWLNGLRVKSLSLKRSLRELLVRFSFWPPIRLVAYGIIL